MPPEGAFDCRPRATPGIGKSRSFFRRRRRPRPPIRCGSGFSSCRLSRRLCRESRNPPSIQQVVSVVCRRLPLNLRAETQTSSPTLTAHASHSSEQMLRDLGEENPQTKPRRKPENQRIAAHRPPSYLPRRSPSMGPRSKDRRIL